MAIRLRGFRNRGARILVFSLQVLILVSVARSKITEKTSIKMLGTESDAKSLHKRLQEPRMSRTISAISRQGALLSLGLCEYYRKSEISGGQFNKHQRDKDVDIAAMYTDTHGVVRILTVKSSELSASWVWVSSKDGDYRQPEGGGEYHRKPDNSGGQFNKHRPDKDVDITAMYTDTHGVLRIHAVKSSELSASWVWGSPKDGDHRQPKGGEEKKTSFRQPVSVQDSDQHHGDTRHKANRIRREKLARQNLRQKRKEKRALDLIQISKGSEVFTEKVTPADNRVTWKLAYKNPKLDYVLEVMKNQIIMAKVYASIARSQRKDDLSELLRDYIEDSRRLIEAANPDAVLHQSVLDQVKEMGEALSVAREQMHGCPVARKLHSMLLFTEENIDASKKENLFLLQVATQGIPRPLHCLALQLTNDYFLHDHTGTELLDKRKLVDLSLYHYAIFSDNVLATSVVINSTVAHAKEPEKHVFHIVTGRLNFPAMTMWFIAHPPEHATVHVENIEDFKWLNSSYCPVLRQLESARMKEYYFKKDNPTSFSVARDQFKYRNPKYLSMLNHIRFYLPELYPKLDRILFLDDDVVVQKDLTPLWSIDMEGMVNAAVDTCGPTFHRLREYVNFSNPEISSNFDPNFCAWAYGMNFFDLEEWRKQDVTSIYHYWQELNVDRTYWRLGSLPPALLAFYNRTYQLDTKWHVLKLGHDPGVNSSVIDDAAVIHYNGNYKPWLDLAYNRYRPYWSKCVKLDNPHLHGCNI